MALLQTDALVLRAVDFGESDRIVHLLTPATGRIAAIAKGARRSTRRFPGTLDLFNRLRVSIERRPRAALARLDHAALRGMFDRVRVETPRFALGCYLLELLDRLAPEGGVRTDTRRLFAFAESALGILDRSPPDARLRVLLELRALDAVGLRPELRVCVRCGRPPAPPLGFHVPDGGPVCEACCRASDALLPIHLGTLRALESGLGFDVERLGRLALGRTALAEAALLISRFSRFHLGLQLRSERFLDEIIPVARAGEVPPEARRGLQPPRPAAPAPFDTAGG